MSEIVMVLEKLASNVNNPKIIHKLIYNQPDEVKRAFLMNDAESLKKLISTVEYLANESHVVQI